MGSLAMEKVGRNERCPCGSGKKYKHCCLAVHTAPDESPWAKQRDASDRLTRDLLKVAANEFGEDLLLAWADFNQMDIPDSLDEYPYEEEIFSPYLVFQWDPEAMSRRVARPRGGVVVRSYLERHGRRLSELELLILEQAISQPISFFEVVSCVPGRSVVLRDVLIGGETEVEEHTATKTMQPGQLAYGQLWILPEVATLGRLAPHIIPPGRKVEIVGLRTKLRRKIAKQNRNLAAGDLIRYAEDIRTVYLDIRDALMAPPRLENTDGDPLEFHTLSFRTGSAQVAFDALAPLAWGHTRDDLLDGAETSEDGTLTNVEMDWIVKGNKIHKSWDNTVMGHIKISGRSLVVEVNSAKRARKIREEIERRLGLHAVHESTKTRTAEEMLKKSEQGRRMRAMAHEPEEAEPELPPEVREHFEAELQKMAEDWVHQKVPALGGRTPLQAVRDPDGREMVEGLLLGWEQSYVEPAGSGVGRIDFGAIRRLLGLQAGV
jgi:hypothetical protein